jgi:hypothetical protein
MELLRGIDGRAVNDITAAPAIPRVLSAEQF